MTVENARKLVKGFEDCTLPKEQWTHQAHFIMALVYCLEVPLPEATKIIRQRIRLYNESVGGKNTDESGYHETITLFYINTVANYIVTSPLTNLTDEQLTIYLRQPFLAKDYLLQFYTEGLIRSKEARRNWVPPNKKAS
jgi:hypothetical protein